MTVPMPRRRPIFLLLSVFLAGLVTVTTQAVGQEGQPVAVEAPRTLHGADSGREYRGYASGTFKLPHDRGGLLIFELWNDVQAGHTAVVNTLNLEVGSRTIRIPSYATRNQIVEFYRETPNDWGPGGGQQVTLVVPPGIGSITFNNQESTTGIEITEARFLAAGLELSGGFTTERIQAPGEPVPNFGRTMHGMDSGRKYHGYTAGTILLPHRQGGVLTFMFYNDQRVGFGSTLNQLNIRVGDQMHRVEQYSTALDLDEFYQETPDDWGPGGGARVTLPVPEGEFQVHLDYGGSQTGFAITDIGFDDTLSGGQSLEIDAHVNRSSKVLVGLDRTMHGAKSGRLYHGYTSGSLILPHRQGGMLRFTFYNDQRAGLGATLNRLNIHVGEQTHQVEQYSTSLDLKEFYKEAPNDWGPGGGAGISVSIPPGVADIRLDHTGSQTGIEIADISFDGSAPGGQAIEVRPHVNPSRDVLVGLNRTMHGEKSGRLYYGYTSGSLILPHREGGVLRFTFYNDQGVGFNTTMNVLNIRAGDRVHRIEQYSTSLDLEEFYLESPNDWGPGGGAAVSIAVSAGVFEVELNSTGSQTGIEIADLSFESGPADGEIRVREYVNRTRDVLVAFGRVLNGQKSGRKYHGYTGGRIALPNRLGGRLFFSLWNDQHKDSEITANQLNVEIGGVLKTVELKTTRADLREFYRETANQWGPAGGNRVALAIPAGVHEVQVNNHGSQTGIELSDFRFQSN